MNGGYLLVCSNLICSRTPPPNNRRSLYVLMIHGEEGFCWVFPHLIVVEYLSWDKTPLISLSIYQFSGYSFTHRDKKISECSHRCWPFCVPNPRYLFSTGSAGRMRVCRICWNSGCHAQLKTTPQFGRGRFPVSRYSRTSLHMAGHPPPPPPR